MAAFDSQHVCAAHAHYVDAAEAASKLQLNIQESTWKHLKATDESPPWPEALDAPIRRFFMRIHPEECCTSVMETLSVDVTLCAVSHSVVVQTECKPLSGSTSKASQGGTMV